MALGVPYEDVLAHAPLAWRDGLPKAHFHTIARAFGVRFLPRHRADIDEETGLLWVDFKDSAHLTYVHYGVLVDPADGTLWKASEYLAAKEGRGLFYAIAPALQHGPRARRHQTR
jgi:hypothetical protein